MKQEKPIIDLDSMTSGQLRDFLASYGARNRTGVNRILIALAHNRLERLETPRHGDVKRSRYYEILYHKLPAHMRWRDLRYAPEACIKPGKTLRRRAPRIILDIDVLLRK